MTPARQDAWKPWLAAILWLILIAIESTNLFSSENTSRFLYPLLTYLFGHIDPVRFSFWHHIGRKVGHVVGYAILSLLLFRAWKATFPSPVSRSWTWRWAQLAFFMTALVASLDEWHQTFLPSRTGTVRDVILDSTAALGAQLLLYLLLRGWRSQAPLPPYA